MTPQHTRFPAAAKSAVCARLEQCTYGWTPIKAETDMGRLDRRPGGPPRQMSK